MSLWNPQFALFLLLGALASPYTQAADPIITNRVTIQPQTQSLRPSDEKAALECSGKSYSDANCMRQADAYQRAAQAAKYLAFYMRNFKEVSNDDKRAKIKEVADRCLVKNQCENGDQDMLLMATIQNNIGKEIRNMVLQNNENHEKMKSINDGANFMFNPDKRNTYGKSRELDDPFKVDPNEVQTMVDKREAMKKAKEQEILGNEFISKYKIFMDTYSKTSGPYQFQDADGNLSTAEGDKNRWHYVSQKTAPSKADDTTDYRTVAEGTYLQANNKVDSDAYKLAQTTQDAKPIQKTAEAYMTEASKKSTDNKTRAEDFSNQIDFLMSNRQEMVDQNGNPIAKDKIPAQTVAMINSEIDKKVAEKRAETASRDPASAGQKQRNPINISVDMDDFSTFLDEIWPPSAAAKPQASAKP